MRDIYSNIDRRGNDEIARPRVIFGDPAVNSEQRHVGLRGLSLPLIAPGKSWFLQGLAPQDLDIILAAAKEQRFSVNSVITRQGEPANNLFLLLRGRVRLFYSTEEGDKPLFVWLTPGKVFGGDTLISKPSLYLVSAEADRESWALVWDRATIQRLATRYPRLMQNALTLASEYLSWHMVDRVSLANHSSRQRLAYVLTSLARMIGEKVPAGIELDATNEELAAAANVGYFTVSRLLQQWHRDHTIEKSRGKLVLRSTEGLAA